MLEYSWCAIVGTRPLPSSGPGALIGYIRQSNGQASQPFLVGTQLTLSVPSMGVFTSRLTTTTAITAAGSR